ncbi:uridylate kinase isoform 2 [Hibiscus syriacus]|uniref:Uridylate kinase isoform 2 n=1 Tax=Hibiscus syriacus TaxID=106335 RepID=A0A6A2YYQ8_HIBSY|nr:uridylate kinase isoform 2 [Hibiscus syriacus]
MASVNCAGAIFYSMMKLAVESPHNSATVSRMLVQLLANECKFMQQRDMIGCELHKNAADIISKWQKLLKSFLHDIDEEIEVILKFEEMCLESAKEFATLFPQILHLLYDKEILQEDALLRWADEKEGADEADKVFLKRSEKFIQWLKEAEEEDDEE